MSGLQTFVFMIPVGRPGEHANPRVATGYPICCDMLRLVLVVENGSFVLHRYWVCAYMFI